MNTDNVVSSMGYETSQLPQKSRFAKIGARNVLLLILISALSVTTVVLYFMYADLKDETDPNQRDFNEVTTNVKQLVNVEEDEKINVARIDNIETLKAENANFYKNAQNGQYLVVFPKSQRVVIYDKTENRIVNFSTYSIKVDVIPEDQIENSEKPLTIEIRYASGVSEQTVENVKKALESASTNYSITSTIQTDTSFKGLTVVLLNREAKPKMSQNLIAHSGTNSITETLPDGEQPSDADAVILLGETN